MGSKNGKKLLLALGPLLILLWLLAGLYWNFRAPRTGLKLQWDEQSWTVLEPVGGLPAGSTIVSLAGEKVEYHTFLTDNAFITTGPEFWSWLKVREAVAADLSGETVVVGFADGPTRGNIELPLRRDSWQFLRSPASTHIIVGLVFLLVGWATYRPQGTDSKALWFYLLCCSMSLVYITNAVSLLAEFSLQPGFFRYNNLLNAANFVLAPALLFHFSQLMPRPRPYLKFFLWPSYAVVFYALLTFSIPLHGMLVAFFFLGSLLSVAQGAFSYRGLMERQQMKWVGVGFLLGLGPWILLNGLPLVVWGQRLMSDTIPGACLVFIPIFMGVAVRKYRLFDVGTFLEGTALYLATLMLLLGVDVLLLSLLDEEQLLGEGSLLSLALLIGLYGPVRAALGRAVKRLSHRDPIMGKELETHLMSALQRATTPEEVVEQMEMLLQEFLAPASMERVAVALPVGAHLQLEQEEARVVLVLAPHEGLSCGPPAGGRVYSSQLVARLSELANIASVYYQALHQTRERERLLGDLHDGVGAALSAIRTSTREQRVSRLAGDALFELQSFLYPGPGYTLEFGEFVAELRSYGNAFFEDSEVKFQLKASHLEVKIDRNMALSLFRFLKEAMNNALKHSGAKHFLVSLDSTPDLISMQIEDDGRGYSTSQSRGRGVESMKKRIQDLNGTFEIDCENGVRYRVEIPQ